MEVLAYCIAAYLIGTVVTIFAIKVDDRRNSDRYLL